MQVARCILALSWATLLALGCEEPTRPLADAGDCVYTDFERTDFAATRAACGFVAGALPVETLGVDRERIPITHVIVVMQENRSFDHMLGRLPMRGHPEVEGIPATYRNTDLGGVEVSPFRLGSLCLEADPPHQGAAMIAQHNDGAMDQFMTTAAVDGSDGHYAHDLRPTRRRRHRVGRLHGRRDRSSGFPRLRACVPGTRDRAGLHGIPRRRIAPARHLRRSRSSVR